MSKAEGQLFRRSLMWSCGEIPASTRWRQQFSLRPSARPYFLDRIVERGGRWHYEDNGIHVVSSPINEGDGQCEAQCLALMVAEMLSMPMLFWGHIRPRPGSVALDLGANIGTTSLLLSKEVGEGGQVFSFEPITHTTVEMNANLNRRSNVTVVPSAIGDGEGVAEFVVCPFSHASHLRYGPNGHIKSNASLMEVPVTSLDAWCDSERIPLVDFIKTDIEGAELMAIKGASRLIQRCRPKWSISTEHVGPDGRFLHSDVVRELKRLGYRVKTVGREYVYAW